MKPLHRAYPQVAHFVMALTLRLDPRRPPTWAEAFDWLIARPALLIASVVLIQHVLPVTVRMQPELIGFMATLSACAAFLVCFVFFGASTAMVLAQLFRRMIP